ncbi:MAG: hypothetical protein ACPG1A_16470 [Halioglobus sp.]
MDLMITGKTAIIAGGSAGMGRGTAKRLAETFGLEKDQDIVMTHFLEHNKVPAGFIADADDMTPMAALLCSPLSRFIVGQNIVIDDGQHHSLF